MNFKEIIKNSIIEDYRNYNAVNYSLLKEISNGNYIAIRDGIPEKTSTYMDFGSYVDYVISNDEEPKDLYTYNAVTLSGHSEVLVEELLKNDMVDCTVDERLKIADKLELWKSTKDVEKRKVLVNSNDINAILNKEIARKENKVIISNEDLILAKHILNVLYTHPFTRDLVKPSLDIEVLKQLAIKFNIENVDCKILLDLVHIDHKNKLIKPFDLKTGTKKSFEENYFKYKYYLQGGLYRKGLEHIKYTYPELQDYQVEPFKFIYISRENPNNPTIHIMLTADYDKTIFGYINYRCEPKDGISNLLDRYIFHKDNNIYDISWEEYDNNGVLILPSLY